MSIELQKQFDELKDRVEQLEGGYHDLAYDYTDGLVKRIEDIRTETLKALQEHAEALRSLYSEANKKLPAIIEEARTKLNQEVSVALHEHKRKVLPTLIDPSTGRLRHH